MCEEKLEKIIAKETKKIENKYERSQGFVRGFQAWEIEDLTGINYEVIKLMNSRRKKQDQIRDLRKDIKDLDYEINFKMGFEIGCIKAKYKIASEMLKNDFSVSTIADSIELTEEQVKQLL